MRKPWTVLCFTFLLSAACLWGIMDGLAEDPGDPGIGSVQVLGNEDPGDPGVG
ncbi:hypothetical protein [Halobacillus litoralis]|uniref:hypothetical protein n=1 Tax=Halobacillus litoralis TaxID=45668 RepID=UPI0013E8C06C|nr:hypothetical protein [Halobacillus litoralis]